MRGHASAVRSTSAPGFFPDVPGSATTRFCVDLEIQSFHHLSNSVCSRVFSIQLPICSSTQWSISWELSQVPVTCGERATLVLRKSKNPFEAGKNEQAGLSHLTVVVTQAFWDTRRTFKSGGDNMQQAIKISHTSAAAVAIACLLGILSFDSAAQEDKPMREVYQAQAMGQLTQMGKTFNVTINIQRYSTPEERQVLVDAFQQAGSKGVFNALEKMNSKGRIAITGTLGYDISFIRKIPTADGYKIRVLTNRPIRFGEAWVNGRSTDYNLSALELNISEDKDKSSGILLPASKFRIEKKTNELELENYQNPWKLQNVMDRSKE